LQEDERAFPHGQTVVTLTYFLFLQDITMTQPDFNPIQFNAAGSVLACAMRRR